MAPASHSSAGISAVSAAATGTGPGPPCGRSPAPASAAVAASARRARWEPSSTTATPAAMSRIPLIFRAPSDSPKSTADAPAVSTTPIAPQRP